MYKLTSFFTLFSSGLSSGSFGVAGAAFSAVPLVVDFLGLDLEGLEAESFLLVDFGVAPFAALGVDEVRGLNLSFFADEDTWGVYLEKLGSVIRRIVERLRLGLQHQLRLSVSLMPLVSSHPYPHQLPGLPRHQPSQHPRSLLHLPLH